MPPPAPASRIERVAVLGLGLLGGSLGLVWKKQNPSLHLTGYDRPEVCARAVERGAVDVTAETPEEAVRDADLVVLAAPIRPILRLLPLIAPHLKPGALVTDVASVKRPVVEAAREALSPEHVFVGGHPMAGSERSGIDFADPFLFENATYVLCPPDGTDPDAFAESFAPLVDLIRLTGARLLLLDAERHDHIAAAVSHLPQLLAVALMNLAAERNERDDAFLRLAAGGFRDMTRIASSSFGIWRDILAANEGPVLDALGAFAAAFQRLRNRLAEGDLDALEEAFGHARQTRDTIPRDSKGFLLPLADVYVYAEDRPGELLQIVRSLYEAELNIKDIELLKIREGTGGAFRLSFVSEAVADTAVEVLLRGGYTAYRL